jgi:hypothetical protein
MITTFFLSVLLQGCSSEGGGPGDIDLDRPEVSEGGDTADEAPLDPTETPDGPDIPDTLEDEGDCVQDIDIVFVIDVSTSMSFVLDQLSAGIEDVWAYTLTFSTEPDYQPAFGLVVFVDDVLVTNSARPYDTAELLRTEFDTWRAFTSTENEPGGGPGTNDDCPENAIDALYAAAAQMPWRDGALHIIIFATDDTFVENPGTLGTGDILVQHTYNEVYSEVLGREIRVSAFAAHVGVCWDHNNAAPGYFEPYLGTPPLPEATGASAFDIQDVSSGTISMTEAVKGVILDEYCTPFVI